MRVNLKQDEIEAALKNFISQQGINLNGKQIEISFTAGRKESGISAELNIEDMELEIPGFTEPEFQAPVLVAVPSGLINRAPELVPEPVVPDDVPEVPVAPVVVTSDEPVKTTSLFG